MSYQRIDIDELIRKEGFRRRYSPRTIKTYQKCVEKFLRSSGKTIDKISKKDARNFLNKLSDKNAAGSTINVHHMAIKFLMEDCLHKRMKLNIRYSKTPRRLPEVLSKEEIKTLFTSIPNEKHKLMVELMYSGGLRVSELTNLKVKDLQIDKGYGFVRSGKGNKDRLFILSPKLKERINNLTLKEKLSDNSYLFISNRKTKYSTRSLGKIIKDSCKISKIHRRVSCHTLRHSFATHLIENGYDVSQVQGLLGHKSPETTMIYLHISSPNMINVRSPIDNL